MEDRNKNMFKVMYSDMLFSNKLQKEENGSFGDTPWSSEAKVTK